MTPLVHLTILLTLAACGGTAPGPSSSPPVEPEPTTTAASSARLPVWSDLADQADAHLTAKALRDELVRPTGRTRVFNFWATWCRPCVVELPELAAFAAEHPDVEVVLVNVDMPAARQSGRIAAVIAKVALNPLANVLLDEEDPAAALLADIPNWPDSIPVTIVIGGDGATRHQLNTATTREQLAKIVSGER